MFKYNGKRKEKNNSVNFLVFANWLNTQLLRTIVVVVFTSGRSEEREYRKFNPINVIYDLFVIIT